MSLLTVREALVSSLRRVDGESRGQRGEDVASIFAVFEGDPARFLGLVTTPTMRHFPSRIFADLIGLEPQSTISSEATVEAAVEQLQSGGARVLAAREADGALVGALTRESLLDALVVQERRLNEALRRNDQRRRTLFSAMPDHAFVLDAHGVYLDRAAMRLDDASSHPLDGEAGQTLEDVLPAVAVGLVRRAMVQCLASGALQTVTVRIGASGHLSTYELRIVQNGSDSVLCVARDVTEMNQIKGQLIFADRMVAMGTLAASMAHEINNPLAYISTNIELLQETIASLSPVPDPLHDAHELLADVREGVRRIAAIVDDLRVFGRGDTVVTTAVDVERVLRAAINIAAPQVRARAQIVTKFSEVPRIQAVEARLGQVFVNLLVNAGQAIPAGDPGANHVEVQLYQEGGAIHVVVADSGTGLSIEARAHLFEAFFTTKGEEQRGTGLGLFISNGIVVALGGRIEIEDATLGGCAFHVVLPMVAPRSSATPAPSRPTSPLLPGRVLVIDDEAALLRSMPGILHPHVVEVVSDGRAALALLAEREPFDVILCDLMMPGMSGVELFNEACARWPELRRRFIFLTGGAYTAPALELVAEESVSVIDKPFQRAALLAAVNRAIQRGRTCPPLSP
ncbi:MAG: ATP-binding protein [Byssovorax sp.]